jgi:hypothetical protein
MESQDEKKCDFYGLKQLKIHFHEEFKIAFQIHSNKTCCCILLYIMECVKLSKEGDL